MGGNFGFTAYHTSIRINGKEYYFDLQGIKVNSTLASHEHTEQAPRRNTQVIPMGKSSLTGHQLTTQIGHFFERQTYDLVQKNCNSFSDAGLFFLLGKRMPSGYRTLDRLGSTMSGV